MSLYAIHEGETLAALRAFLALHERREDTVETMLEAIYQHPAATLASAMDDARCGLDEACPDCAARPGQECHPDCSSRWK